MPAKQIEYEMRPDDIASFNWYHHQHSPAVRSRYLRVLIGIPVIVACLLLAVPLIRAVDVHSYLQNLRKMWWLLLFPPCFVIWFPFSFRRRVKRLVRQMLSEGSSRGLFGTRTIRMDGRGITSETEGSSTSTLWNYVEKITVADTCTYVYVSAISAVIIPRRAFESDSKYLEFVEQARNYFRNAAGTLPG